MNKHAQPDLTAAAIKGGVASDQRHDSAAKHVTGQAVYIDDIAEPAGTLHGCLGLSTIAHGTIRTMDL
jgi:xanthine dehydrogenase large subunit